MTFNDFLSEIKYSKDNKINISNRPTEYSLKNVIYSGKKYILFNDDMYFLLTDKNRNLLFYIQYQKNKNKYYLGLRENISSEKDLFFKIVYTLLLKGFVLIEDYQHNELSIKAIKKLINSNIIEVLYDGKNITDELIDNNFDDNDINKTFEYRIKNHDNSKLIESRFLIFENEDYFDTCEFFILNTKETNMLTFKEFMNENKDVDSFVDKTISTINSINSSTGLSITELAQGIAKVVINEYGSHNYDKFINIVRKEFDNQVQLDKEEK